MSLMKHAPRLVDDLVEIWQQFDESRRRFRGIPPHQPSARTVREALDRPEAVCLMFVVCRPCGERDAADGEPRAAGEHKPTAG